MPQLLILLHKENSSDRVLAKGGLVTVSGAELCAHMVFSGFFRIVTL